MSAKATRLPHSMAADKRKRPKAKAGDRFDPGVIADRLEALRELADVKPWDVGSAIWTNQTAENAARSWYKRATQKRQAFNLAEIQAAVDYLVAEASRTGKLNAKVLPGFPFVDLWVSIAIERGELSRVPTGPRRV